MTTTDKIKSLPDGYVFEATPWTRIDSPVNDGFVEGKHVEFSTDELKALADRLAEAERIADDALGLAHALLANTPEGGAKSGGKSILKHLRSRQADLTKHGIE